MSGVAIAFGVVGLVLLAVGAVGVWALYHYFLRFVTPHD
jgi:hypothetical protein